LTVVILPVVPNRSIGPFGINPFKTWLVITAVSTVSYVSYLLQILTIGKGGVVFSALLGGGLVQACTYLKAPKMPLTTVRTWLSFGSGFFFDSTHTEVAKDMNFDAVD
jgi:hypothetical protein